ncbi:hypothetical protein C2845_PM05G10620 [Panicum miliaceum]|uniref:Uncharacterized protein n=1 Tax=Panicum miliaceum TaxID=4540 RepID=A0A3L6T0S0_PANMI|nr:hypothetical protein C2845_PM05G10620 [Panicum miliaceum]
MASYAEDVDAIAAYEDEDDYIMVFTGVPSSTSPHGAGAATSSSSSSSPSVHAEEEEQMPPPSASSSSSSSPNVHTEEEQMPAPSCPSGAASLACDEHDGMVETADAAAEVDAAPAPQQDVRSAAAPPSRVYVAPSNEQGARGWADAGEDEEDDDEVTDEDEDDYLYHAHYDRADHGRSRHVKRSSGRRGRTKKASTIGRPRGGHLSHVAGALCT